MADDIEKNDLTELKDTLNKMGDQIADALGAPWRFRFLAFCSLVTLALFIVAVNTAMVMPGWLILAPLIIGFIPYVGGVLGLIALVLIVIVGLIFMVLALGVIGLTFLFRLTTPFWSWVKGNKARTYRPD